jgi:hypothetical protein
MKTKKELNYIVKLEHAIAKKYGDETIINPKSRWTDEKEEQYLKDLKEHYIKTRKSLENTEKIEEDGFLIPKNLITRKSKRKCPICNVFSFETKDDLYMNKFECCFECYVQWVEDREERWLKGWRPQNEKKEQKEN